MDNRDKMILDNQNLIHHSLKRFNIDLKSNYYDDFVSIAQIGLIKAADKFNSVKGYAFSTYASTCINNEII